MTLRDWFCPRLRGPGRRTTRARLGCEALEHRLAPAIQLNYLGANSTLNLREQSAVANDTLTISTFSGDFLDITLGAGQTFDALSTPAQGDGSITYSGSTPETSRSALVRVFANTDLLVSPGGGSDTVTLGFTNASGNLRNVIVGVVQAAGDSDIITLNSMTLGAGGNLL